MRHFLFDCYAFSNSSRGSRRIVYRRFDVKFVALRISLVARKVILSEVMFQLRRSLTWNKLLAGQ